MELGRDVGIGETETFDGSGEHSSRGGEGKEEEWEARKELGKSEWGGRIGERMGSLYPLATGWLLYFFDA